MVQILLFPLFSFDHGLVSDRGLHSACFLSCMLSVLVILKLGVTDVHFCVHMFSFI